MRKKYVVFLAVLLIGLSNSSLSVVAEESEAAKTTEAAETMETGKTEEGEGEIEPSSEEMPESEKTERVSLQIPQKLQVVMDPFEIDGREQIYSEPYTIWNTGEIAGVLTLSFSCRSGEGRGVEFCQEKNGIHEGDRKYVYIEIVFEDEKCIILSTENSEYQVELAPGEGVSLYFVGELNENASEQWRDGDVMVEGIYTWDEKKGILPEEDEDKEIDTVEGTEEETSAVKEEETSFAVGEPEKETSVDEEEPEKETSAEKEVLEETEGLKGTVSQNGEEEEVPDKGLNEDVSGKDEEENGKE